MSLSCALLKICNGLRHNYLGATTGRPPTRLVRLFAFLGHQQQYYRCQHAPSFKTSLIPENYRNPNENDFIFKHIHARLIDRFSGLAESAPKLPIYPFIQKLGCSNRVMSHSDDLFVSIKNKIKQMNQMELATLLTYINDYDTPDHRAVKQVIDLELRWLLKEHVKTRLMDLDLWLYIANLFYQARIKSKFVQVLINYLTDETEIAMTNKQMLHLLFLVVLQRKSYGILEKYEERIKNLASKASYEDIAIICSAYFKTQSVIKNVELLRIIIDKTIENLGTLDPKQPGYCSIIKSVRYSRTPACRENVLRLILSLTDISHRQVIFTSPFNAVQTVKLMESFRVYDKKLLDLFRSTMFKNLEEFRIKDIQYALTSLSNIAYRDLQLDDAMKQDFDKLSRHIVKEIRDDVNYQYFHLLPIVRALATFGYYNDELIAYSNRILNDSDKFNMMKGVLEFEKSTLLVYNATMIEGGQEKLKYSPVLRNMAASIMRVGNFGSVKQDSSLRYLDFILRDKEIQLHYPNSNSYRLLAKSLAISPQLSAPGYLLNFQYTLPHLNYADLVVSKDRREPGSFDSKTLLPANVSPNEHHCLVMATHQTDFVDGHSRLSGYKRFLIRLFTKLNYKVVTVDFQAQDVDLLARRIKNNLD